jgi:CRISPR-associated protein Cas1
MLTATVQARREQIQALNDERSFIICRTVVEAKIHNQASLLQYFAKYLRNVNPLLFQEIVQIARELKSIRTKVRSLMSAKIQETRPVLMGFEGTAGRLYWEGVKKIVAEKTTFMGRAHRGATDVMNALLNYGYGILYTQVWSAVVLAGLEPFVGFLHVDRPGKPSLVLDLVEEFRQPVVDRAVIATINLGQSFEMEGGLLDAESRKNIAAKILDRLETKAALNGKTYQIRSIIQIQARNLAGFLRGEREYKPFRFKW